MSVTREKLYEEIWAEPATKVAPRYGVSSNFLARVCDRLRVPRPERGYWAQLEVGKALPRPPLPEALPGEELEWRRDGEPQRAPRALPAPPDPGAKPPVPPRWKRSTRLHELIAGAREHILAGKLTDIGYQRPLKRRVVDLFVSPGTLDRALSVANELFLTLVDRGHRVTFAPFDQHLRRPAVDERMSGKRERYYYGGWAPDRPTVTYVGTVAVGLSLYEMSKEVEVRYHEGKWVPVSDLPTEKRIKPAWERDWGSTKHDLPSGKLCLRASSPYHRADWERHWREEGHTKLASQIPKIVEELEAGVFEIARLVEEGEKQAEIERRALEVRQGEWRRQQAEAQRLQNLKDSHDQLFAIIDAWGVAKRIEEFFDDTEKRAAGLGEPERASVLLRVERARRLLGGVDALKRFAAWRTPEDR